MQQVHASLGKAPKILQAPTWGPQVEGSAVHGKQAPGGGLVAQSRRGTAARPGRMVRASWRPTLSDRRARSLTLLVWVAENSRVWRWRGMLEMMALRVAEKPMSRMRSASSSTSACAQPGGRQGKGHCEWSRH